MTPREPIDTAAQRPPRAAADARTVVVGLGRTGLSCARFLHARGVAFAVTDSRASPPELAALARFAPHADVRTGGFDPSLIESADRIVVSPGVSLREPFLMRAASRGVPIVGDI